MLTWRTRFTLRHGVGLVAAASFAMCAAAPPAAQQAPPVPTREELAKDNKLFIALARRALKWDEPTIPAKIVGPLHYVGTAGLASYLFATKEGHILFNTGMPESGPMIVASMRTLGFAAKDIKILINGHGHSDHAGAFAFSRS
jgi:metallo-beta-lactamase class B